MNSDVCSFFVHLFCEDDDITAELLQTQGAGTTGLNEV
jgi:hypothetical protein